MEKILRSRTVWTVVLMFLIGGFESIGGLIPGGFTTAILGGLGLLATYFKMSPSQSYGE